MNRSVVKCDQCGTQVDVELKSVDDQITEAKAAGLDDEELFKRWKPRVLYPRGWHTSLVTNQATRKHTHTTLCPSCAPSNNNQ